MKMRTKELQRARKRLGLSVAQVAADAKVSPAAIRRLERDDLGWSTLDQLRWGSPVRPLHITHRVRGPVTVGANHDP